MTSNFSFSHNVFHTYISLVCQNAALRGNGLSPLLPEHGSIKFCNKNLPVNFQIQMYVIHMD